MTPPLSLQIPGHLRWSHVVNAIAAAPEAEHPLGALAHLACLSPFHFHRVYHAEMGETLAATVRRVRMREAASRMLSLQRSIADVAQSVGYDSPQAFTRAFARHMGQAPSAFRQSLQLPSNAPDRAPVVGQEYLPARVLLALRHRGPLATVAHTHHRLRLALAHQPLDGWWGVSGGHPTTYWAAAQLPAKDDRAVRMAPEDALALPEGWYAVYRLTGPYTRIGATLQVLTNRWLPALGYQQRPGPVLERYLNSPRDVPAAPLKTDLLIPIHWNQRP